MRLLFPGETLGDFLSRPGLYKRLRYRLRLALWDVGVAGVEPEWRLLPVLVDRTRAAVDVGANYGAYAGALCRLATRVHCFEPIPQLAAMLRVRLPPQVTVYAAAASDHAGETTLVVPLRPDGTVASANASIERSNPDLANYPSLQKITCPVVRLDDVVQEPVGFIKIDVEGHEYSVLKGAERIIRECRPVFLIESTNFMNSDSPGRVIEFLKAHGYDALFLFDGRLHPLEAFAVDKHQRLHDGRPVEPFVYNFIFLPVGAP